MVALLGNDPGRVDHRGNRARLNGGGMTRPPPHGALTLAWYAVERVVMTDEKKKWPHIRRWEQARLVTVRPINRTSARVVLTDVGRERVETGA